MPSAALPPPTPATTPYDADLALARRLADTADAITMDRFGALDLRVSAKPDLTPVSDADRSAEHELRAILARERPDDAVLGEEYGESGTAARRWVIDPIDGTKNYVRTVPVWATLVALQQDERTVAGVVSAPALGRRWWACRGGGAWTSYGAGSTRACRVSRVARLEDAFVSYSSLSGWPDGGRSGGFADLLALAWRTRAFGDFWSHMLVAEGAVDVSCEPEVSLWDIAALQVIVEEAGGRFTDLSGRERADGGSVLATNGLLHSAALGLLAT